MTKARADHPVANELFPSADWRYLLPDPAPASVVVLANDDSDLSTVVHRLGTSDPPGRPDLDADGGWADLGVADRADPETIERLHGLVRPGGTIYLEMAWPRTRSAAALADRLTVAGLSDAVLYSLSPSRDRWSASWWIPLGHAEAVRFVVGRDEHRRRAGRPILARLRTGVGRVVSAAPVLARNHPWLLWPTRRRVLCAVAIKPGAVAEGAPSARPGLVSSSMGASGNERTTVMRVGGSSTDQAMLFGFGDGPQPDLVIKAPTRTEELAASRHESEVLTFLTDRPDPMPGVPRAVSLDIHSSVAAWGQTFLPGPALAGVVSPTNLHRHAADMTEWLIELARRTETTGGDGIAADAVDRLEPLWHQLPDGASLRGGVMARVAGFRRSISVCQHQDLGPWNTMVDGGVLGVIDWADAERSGTVLCDLHHFLAHLVLCAHDAYGLDRSPEVIDRLVDPRSEVGGLVERSLARYALAVGLDADEVRALRVLTWLLDLLRRPESEQADSLYLDLLRAEVR
ncbi:MAG: hypothetical protein AAFN30_06920 [Actinomycetota bacterium]